jgi:hypothetical protein
MFITGIGSRKTPAPILTRMEQIAERAGLHLSYTLRSGAAPGADTAFERGWDTSGGGKKEIYLPWAYFEKHSSELYLDNLPKLLDAWKITEMFHPKPSALTRGPRALIMRNAHQVLGRDLLTPSDLVLCWNDGGYVRGGTSQAMRIARHYRIPVINMHDEDWQAQLEQFEDQYDMNIL